MVPLYIMFKDMFTVSIRFRAMVTMSIHFRDIVVGSTRFKDRDRMELGLIMMSDTTALPDLFNSLLQEG